jgi:hypothetical protein
MKYDSFKYFFPPRPEYKCPPDDLDKYDNGEYLASPKYNGTALVVATNGIELHVDNRHKESMPLLAKSQEIDFKGLSSSGKWVVFAGEYLNKGKYGETGEKERNKFIIWDILVHENDYLVGSTTQDRLTLLESIFPCGRMSIGNKIEMYDHLCCTQLKGIYKAPTYLNNFRSLYKDIIKTDLYEGIVLKKKDAKLSFGLQELNNHDWQIKCRKETKLYKF